MIVIKAEADGKEISRIDVINQDLSSPFRNPEADFSVCDYRYETKPHKGLFVRKDKGVLSQHFSEQSIWALMQKVLTDMQDKGSIDHSVQLGVNAQPAPQKLLAKAEIWPHGSKEGAFEIGRIEISEGSEGATYQILDPEESIFALKGAGSLKSHFSSQPAWSLVKEAIEDVHRQGILVEKKTGPVRSLI